MQNLSHPVVAEGAFLTLHYRLVLEDGTVVVSTFEDRPATIHLGASQLAAPLESCLIGLHEGAHRVFELAPGQAFGARNPELVQAVSRETLNQHSAENENYAIGDLVEFAAPAGGRFAGTLIETNPDSMLFDFNHPLAGKAVKFEVRIIGIL